MDRNTITGLVLMMALLLGYQWYIAPTEEEIAAWEAEQAQTQAEEDSLASIEAFESQREAQTLATMQQGDTTNQLAAELARRFGPFGLAVPGTDRDVVMANDQVRVTFNTRGGMPVSAVLQDGYKRYGSDEPVSLWIPELSAMNVTWDVPGVGQVGFQDLHFRPISEGPAQVVLQAQAGPGRSIRLVHRLEGYQVLTDVQFQGFEGLTNNREFSWNAVGQRNEKGLQWERQHSAIYYLELGEERAAAL